MKWMGKAGSSGSEKDTLLELSRGKNQAQDDRTEQESKFLISNGRDKESRGIGQIGRAHV